MELCFATQGHATVEALALVQTDPAAAGGTKKVWQHIISSSTDGGTACVWYDVDVGVNRGAAFIVTMAGPGTVELGGVRVAWKRG